MKTLVIHPKDETTDFLKCIYDDGSVTLLYNMKNFSDDFIKSQIEYNDRIIMLGHGTPQGLLSKESDSMYGYGYCIDPSFKNLFVNKEVIAIWCNADQYMADVSCKKAFFTGMFISEVAEAEIFGIRIDQKSVTESNFAFSKEIGRQLKEYGWINVNELYSNYVTNCPVREFNSQRFYTIN